jgi:hypothetical protein
MGAGTLQLLIALKQQGYVRSPIWGYWAPTTFFEGTTSGCHQSAERRAAIP